jgi:hypothetical protein
MNGYHAHAEATDLAALAGLLADDTRASFCLALLDGRAWTATELARHAGRSALQRHLGIAGEPGRDAR